MYFFAKLLEIILITRSINKLEALIQKFRWLIPSTIGGKGQEHGWDHFQNLSVFENPIPHLLSLKINFYYLF